MKKQLLITAALLMGCVSYTFANVENFKPMTLQEMDKNGDAVLSKDEVCGRLLENFDQLDTDGSGTLSAGELPLPKNGQSGKHHKRPGFEEIDKNADGVLTKDEVRGRLLENFDQLDTDGSGTLSTGELPLPKNGQSGKHHKRPGFEEIDTNADGVLTKDEVRGGLLENFEQLDTDGSGTLSADELPQAKKQASL